MRCDGRQYMCGDQPWVGSNSATCSIGGVWAGTLCWTHQLVLHANNRGSTRQPSSGLPFRNVDCPLFHTKPKGGSNGHVLVYLLWKQSCPPFKVADLTFQFTSIQVQCQAFSHHLLLSSLFLEDYFQSVAPRSIACWI